MSASDPEAQALARTLARRVRDEANRRGANDADIARGTGLPAPTVSRVLSGTLPPTLDTAARLARWAGRRVTLAPQDNWDRAHAGHDTHTTHTTPAGIRRCRTCLRGGRDVDHAVVARLVAGLPVDAVPIAERRESVRILTRRGLSAREIALRAGVCSQTIVRDRALLRRLGGGGAVAA